MAKINLKIKGMDLEVNGVKGEEIISVIKETTKLYGMSLGILITEDEEKTHVERVRQVVEDIEEDYEVKDTNIEDDNEEDTDYIDDDEYIEEEIEEEEDEGDIEDDDKDEDVKDEDIDDEEFKQHKIKDELISMGDVIIDDYRKNVIVPVQQLFINTDIKDVSLFNVLEGIGAEFPQEVVNDYDYTIVNNEDNKVLNTDVVVAFGTFKHLENDIMLTSTKVRKKMKDGLKEEAENLINEFNRKSLEVSKKMADDITNGRYSENVEKYINAIKESVNINDYDMDDITLHCNLRV